MIEILYCIYRKGGEHGLLTALSCTAHPLQLNTIYSINKALEKHRGSLQPSVKRLGLEKEPPIWEHVFCLKIVDCSPQVVNKSLSQVKEFKYIGILESGHELWVVTETIRLWIQAAEMNFLWAQA